MRAIVVREFGPPSVMRLEDVAALYQAHSGLVAQRQQQVDQYNSTLNRGKSELDASIPQQQ